MIRLIFTITLVVFILQSIVLGSSGTLTMELASGQAGQAGQAGQQVKQVKQVSQVTI